MDKKLTAYILRYLLEHRFDSKSEMARQLGIDKHTMQRLFRNLDGAKAGTIALDKAILFCACHNISLDAIIQDFFKENEGKEIMQEGYAKRAACQRLRMKEPTGVTEEGTQIYGSMVQFLRRASAYVCPSCENWCSPWDEECDIDKMDCYIGHIACSIHDNVVNCYSATMTDAASVI